jgi:hypothetical protein
LSKKLRCPYCNSLDKLIKEKKNDGEEKKVGDNNKPSNNPLLIG